MKYDEWHKAYLETMTEHRAEFFLDTDVSRAISRVISTMEDNLISKGQITDVPASHYWPELREAEIWLEGNTKLERDDEPRKNP